MASQIRHFVVFLASAGIYQAGDHVALTEKELAQFRKHVDVKYEQHEELDENGRVIPDSVKKVVPEKAEPAPDVSKENAALKAKIAELEKAKAAGEREKQLEAENEKLKAKLAELEAGAPKASSKKTPAPAG